ncbi:LamG domain-containing protein, partial [Candidatus Woesebacteria bacterium]|nr:LamG domain-containing protein [Candidatus Woesebacteria bacterium]
FSGDTSINYYAGLRFTNLQVPKMAVISNARINTMNAWDGTFVNEKAELYFEASDDTATFSSGSPINNRTSTSSSGTWFGSSEYIEINSWFADTVNHKPPQLSSALQEVVDRSGWVSGNDVSVIIKPSTTGTDGTIFPFYSQDDLGSGNEPKLTVSWTASQIMAVQASSANDITSWSANTILDTSTNTNKYGVIVPRTSGAVYATWIDGAAIEGKNFNGTSWDGSPTAIATGLSGLSNTLSALADSSGNVHLTYIDSGGLMVYKKFTSSWQTAVTLDSNAANNYPTISLNTNNSDLYAFWERGDDIFYNKNTNISSSGDALDFDGSADYVKVPYNANFDYTTDLTVEFWFNPDNTVDSGISTNLGILSKANTNTDANNDWAFFWNSGNAGRLRFGSYGDYIQTTTSTWTAGTWYHVSATVTSSNTAYIYVNGVLDNYGGDTTIAADNINANQDTALNIGLAKVATGDLYFDGKIDDFRIYNTARSEAQIQSDMSAELVGDESNLGGYWNFNDGTGQTVNDISSNNNDGTLGATSGSSTDDPTWTSNIPYSSYWNPTATSWQTTGVNTYLTSNYSGANKIFVEWMDGTTIDWDQITLNARPATPSLDLPTDAATSQILSTVLKTTTTDSESDYIRYKVELCEDSGMSVNCQTFDQTSSQTGWTGQDAQTSTAYASGTQATYTLQTPLAPNDTYYWRSYAIDPAGSNSWSTTQGTPYSFTTIAAPVISSVSVNGGSAITLTEGTTTSINWTGTITDADGNANISSAQGVLYRSGVAGAEACTPSNANCYVDASCSLSACAGNSCTATCNVSLQFFAEPTDSASLFPTEYWRGWIEATDASSNTGEGWSPTTTPDVQSLAAMDTSSTIAYDPLLPGDDTGATNETTTVTNTGNTVLDIEVSGDNFCTDYPTCAGYQIPVGYQEFDVTGFTYGLGNPLSGSPATAQINLIKSTINPANSTTSVYWGLGIPSPKEDGAYSGANTLTAVDGD